MPYGCSAGSGVLLVRAGSAAAAGALLRCLPFPWHAPVPCPGRTGQAGGIRVTPHPFPW